MTEFLHYLHRFVFLTIHVFQALIFLRVILSWIPSGGGKIAVLTWQVTEPLLAPLRAIMPGTGPIDLSPMIAYILLEIILYFL